MVTRQQKRYLKRQARKDAARKPQGKHVKPFARPMAYAAKAAAIARQFANEPVARMNALAALPPYKSRGHGWGLRQPSHNARAARSKYMPHQGARECDRRMVGGYWRTQSRPF